VAGKPLRIALLGCGFASEYPETFLIPRQPRLKVMPQLIILEFLVHHIDTMRFLFGDLNSIYAQVRSPVRTVAGETVVAFLMNQGPVLALLDTIWASYGYPATTSADTMAVEGTGGSLFLDSDVRLTLHRANGRFERIPVDTTDPYVRMYWGPSTTSPSVCEMAPPSRRMDRTT
jgi:predicted dehydrogenase